MRNDQLASQLGNGKIAEAFGLLCIARSTQRISAIHALRDLSINMQEQGNLNKLILMMLNK